MFEISCLVGKRLKASKFHSHNKWFFFNNKTIIFFSDICFLKYVVFQRESQREGDVMLLFMALIMCHSHRRSDITLSDSDVTSLHLWLSCCYSVWWGFNKQWASHMKWCHNEKLADDHKHKQVTSLSLKVMLQLQCVKNMSRLIRGRIASRFY